MRPGPSRRPLIGADGSAQNRRRRSIGVTGAEPGEVTGSMDPDEDKGKEGGVQTAVSVPLSGHLTFTLMVQKIRLDLKRFFPVYLLSSNCIYIKLVVQNHIPEVHRRNAIRKWASKSIYVSPEAS